MNKIEKEVKIKVNEEIFYKVLSNFSEPNFKQQKNIFYKNSLGRIVRLRIEEKKIALTFKKELKSSDKLKVSNECEMELDYVSKKLIEDLMNFFGFENFFSYTKYRINIPFCDCVISFDKIGDNYFYIEVEGEKEKIWKIMKELNLENTIFEKKSYLEILGGVKWVA